MICTMYIHMTVTRSLQFNTQFINPPNKKILYTLNNKIVLNIDTLLLMFSIYEWRKSHCLNMYLTY